MNSGHSSILGKLLMLVGRPSDWTVISSVCKMQATGTGIKPSSQLSSSRIETRKSLAPDRISMVKLPAVKLNATSILLIVISIVTGTRSLNSPYSALIRTASPLTTHSCLPNVIARIICLEIFVSLGVIGTALILA